MCTSSPEPRARMEGSTARLMRCTPTTLTSKSRAASSGVNASVCPIAPRPALFTTTSMCPASSRTSFTAPSTEAWDCTSSSRVRTRTPSRSAHARRSAAAPAFFPARPRIEAKTVCPFLASVFVVKRPKPLLVPVMSTFMLPPWLVGGHTLRAIARPVAVAILERQPGRQR